MQRHRTSRPHGGLWFHWVRWEPQDVSDRGGTLDMGRCGGERGGKGGSRDQWGGDCNSLGRHAGGSSGRRGVVRFWIYLFII